MTTAGMRSRAAGAPHATQFGNISQTFRNREVATRARIVQVVWRMHFEMAAQCVNRSVLHIRLHTAHDRVQKENSADSDCYRKRQDERTSAMPPDVAPTELD